MRNSLITYALAAICASGIAFTQTPTPDSGPNTVNTQPGRRKAMRGQWNLEHLSQTLNLTDSQKTRAQTIFQTARQSAEPIRQELKQNREELRAATKVSNNDGQIEKLATEQGRLLGKLIGIHAAASAKFYQILTPEQRAKADEMRERFRQRMRSEMPETEPR